VRALKKKRRAVLSTARRFAFAGRSIKHQTGIDQARND
jgi:hypothetical protein